MNIKRMTGRELTMAFCDAIIKRADLISGLKEAKRWSRDGNLTPFPEIEAQILHAQSEVDLIGTEIRLRCKAEEEEQKRKFPGI